MYGYDSQGHLLTEDVANPDSSTADYTFNASGQLTSADIANTDGSTSDSTLVYSADGSYSDSVVTTPAGAGGATTTVYGYDTQGQLASENTYQPTADGSYTDTWWKADGSHGSYWWNSSTLEYQDTWYHADGSHWTDDYQYAAGGSPGATGVSYTETYTASDGSQGTRAYDASSNTTSLTWNSSQTGALSGTVSGDAGLIGLQTNGELSNSQSDLTFFNPAVSPQFHAFLEGH